MSEGHTNTTKPLDSALLASVEAVALDVDGVLTRGDIIYMEDRGEIKCFNVKDGLGIRMLHLAGIHVAVITGRASGALNARLDNLGVTNVWSGTKQKVPALEEMADRLGTALDRMVFLGDDLPDLGAMCRVGIPVAVADAHAMIRERARMVTAARGGRGAVRELAEALVQAQGKWERILEIVSA
ncbi:MAG: KdsC family phosphatase [Desulfatibacillaceae bacterium]